MSTILIGGDLVVSSMTVPAKEWRRRHHHGDRHDHEFRRRRGLASATRFYLSANSVLDASDTLLAGAHLVPDLAHGAASSASTSLTLPAVSVGTYYIIAKADDDNVVLESRETNNTLARLIAIGADLVVTTVTAPTVSGAGASLTVTDTTTNQGGGTIGPSSTNFYLSTDSVLDGSDTLLGRRDIGPLDAAAASSGSTAITIPASTPPGTYYIVAKADGDAAQVETLERTIHTLAAS